MTQIFQTDIAITNEFFFNYEDNELTQVTIVSII